MRADLSLHLEGDRLWGRRNAVPLEQPLSHGHDRPPRLLAARPILPLRHVQEVVRGQIIPDACRRTFKQALQPRHAGALTRPVRAYVCPGNGLETAKVYEPLIL